MRLYLLSFLLFFCSSVTARTTDTLSVGDRVRIAVGIVELNHAIGNVNQLSINRDVADGSQNTIQDISITLPSLLTPDSNLGIIEGSFLTGESVWSFILKTIVKEGEGRIISDTFGVVNDGQTLTFDASSKEPYQSIKVIGNSEQLVIEFIDVGVKAKLVPKVKEGAVEVSFDFEISEVLREAEEKESIPVPVISVRHITTTLTVKDDELVILGGLDQEKKIIVESGIPFLRRIPLIGAFFSSKERKRAKTHLYIIAKVSPIKEKDDKGYRKLREENSKEITPGFIESLR